MIDQDLAPVLEECCLKQLRLGKAASTNHIQINIHATAAKQTHSSPTSPWKSPRATAAREIAEMLNIARNAGPSGIFTSQTLRKSLLLDRGAAHGILAKSWFFMKISKFHRPESKFARPITFHWKFLEAHTCTIRNYTLKISDWRKAKRKRVAESRARVKKNTPKIWIITSNTWPKFATGERKILLKTASFKRASLQASFIKKLMF